MDTIVRTYYETRSSEIIADERMNGSPHTDTRVRFKTPMTLDKMPAHLERLRERGWEAKESVSDWKIAYSMPNGWSMPEHRRVATATRYMARSR